MDLSGRFYHSYFTYGKNEALVGKRKLWVTQGPVKMHIWLSGPGWGLRGCISHQLSRDAQAAGPQTTLHVARDYVACDFPSVPCEQAPLSIWLKIRRKIYWFLPSPTSNPVVHLRVNTFESFPFSMFSLPTLLSSGKGIRRHSVFLGRMGSAKALVSSPGFNGLQKGQNGDHQRSSARSTRTRLYQENRKQSVRILEFWALCLLFYKYPQVLSGAWIWSHCANFLLVPGALIKITHPGTLLELTARCSSSEVGKLHLPLMDEEMQREFGVRCWVHSRDIIFTCQINECMTKWNRKKCHFKGNCWDKQGVWTDFALDNQLFHIPVHSQFHRWAWACMFKLSVPGTY